MVIFYPRRLSSTVARQQEGVRPAGSAICLRPLSAGSLTTLTSGPHRTVSAVPALFATVGARPGPFRPVKPASSGAPDAAGGQTLADKGADPGPNPD